jgi:hypothetical protein
MSETCEAQQSIKWFEEIETEDEIKENKDKG